ncbi:MAG: peroxidase-related enzyme [Puia sp.]|nr:peroxidase-related enzyme [Puia sp.]
MAHIQLNNEHMPGIIGLLNYSPATAAPLTGLANALLAADSSLTKAERELIAASVSWWNGCHFCHTSHAAVAVAHSHSAISLIDDIKKGLPETAITGKLRALLQIAHQVQKGGKHVTEADILAAREEGATDKEIHDTVLIAAAFCMYNRYVDGLGTWAPAANEDYIEMGKMIAESGYGAAVPQELVAVS